MKICKEQFKIRNQHHALHCSIWRLVTKVTSLTNSQRYWRYCLQEAFAVLGFTVEEKMALYRCTSAVMQFGDMKFKQRPREEQAEADGTAEAEKVTFQLFLNMLLVTRLVDTAL